MVYRKLKRKWRWTLLVGCLCELLWCYMNFPFRQETIPIVAEETFYDKLARSLQIHDMVDMHNVTTCDINSLVVDGQPWPNCKAKLEWLEQHRDSNACFRKLGVNDDPCSWYRYLSQVEFHCPPLRVVKTKNVDSYVEEEADFATSLKEFLGELPSHANLQWMKNRMAMMEPGWVKATKYMSERNGGKKRKKKKMLVHLGLMQFGIGKNAGKGGPLGELVQWSDLIASLHMLGHEVVLTQDKFELKGIFSETISNLTHTCKNESVFPFDLIYTDIAGTRHLAAALGSNYIDFKCRLRVVDSFGTEALMNKNSYLTKKKLKASAWGGLEYQLKQFQTMFPHTPDNSFLGFVIENPTKIPVATDNERNIVLVYGKRGIFWKGQREYIDIVHEYFDEIHATVNDELEYVPSYVKIHNVLPMSELIQLYRKTKVFLGLGFPFEGPAPLEAVANGAVFINPIFGSSHSDFFNKKPTKRKLSSQNPYAEDYIGEPHVFTVDVTNTAHLRFVLEKIKSTPQPPSYLPHDFTFLGMLERLNMKTEHQNFCEKQQPNAVKWWPPLKSLQILLANESEDCTTICKTNDLICEPSYFPILNRKETFSLMGMQCNQTVEMDPNEAELDFPAFDKAEGKCYLQTEELLFSCSGRFTGNIRLCPCRDFVHGCVAFSQGWDKI